MSTKLVTVGNATVYHKSTGRCVITLTGYDEDGRESLELTPQELHMTLESLFTTQRASSDAEWETLPPAMGDYYDAVIYTSYLLRAAGGEDEFQPKVATLQSRDRFEIPESQPRVTESSQSDPEIHTNADR